jgi:sugar/nucleoside kinase (ribokinase family)
MELKPHYDILIPGSYFCDIIFTGLPAFPALGTEIYCDGLSVVPGGVMNTVIGLRRLGVNVGWCGVIGDDFFSRFALEQAEREGLDTRLLVRDGNAVKRVTVALSAPEDRAFISYVDSSPTKTDLAYLALERATFSHLHFTGLVTEERTADFIDACHAQGILVSMDCQHRDVTLAEVAHVLSKLDLFMPNASEALRLTCTDTLSNAIDRLAKVVPLVVIKNGAGGAIARHEGTDYAARALTLTPVDTTGAGDVFNAGFLAAHLRGYDVPTCLQWGNFCGGMSTQAVGGATSAPTLDALQAWLSRS